MQPFSIPSREKGCQKIQKIGIYPLYWLVGFKIGSDSRPDGEIHIDSLQKLILIKKTRTKAFHNNVSTKLSIQKNLKKKHDVIFSYFP